jgi:hypothetical protein
MFFGVSDHFQLILMDIMTVQQDFRFYVSAGTNGLCATSEAEEDYWDAIWDDRASNYKLRLGCQRPEIPYVALF